MTDQLHNFSPLLSLTQAAAKLSVSPDTLLRWNNSNILTPTITPTGEIGYKEEQINQFLAIQQLSSPTPSVSAQPIEVPIPRSPKITASRPSMVPFFSFSAFAGSLAAMLAILLIQPQPPLNHADTATMAHNVPIDTSDLPPVTTPPPAQPAGTASLLGYAQTTHLVSAGDVLATADSTATSTIDHTLLLTLLVPGLFLILFLFSKPLAFSFPNSKNAAVLMREPSAGQQDSILLEIDQKADGAVVLRFQEREYKVSKPELDSESDQLIERLMELSKPLAKEIDYDAFTDPKIKLNTPLSKLVTRLGFVGLKRDLFFPRTSKNRVLFRRYLTPQDLASMNLNLDQVSQSL